jgi:hypothetical protein
MTGGGDTVPALVQGGEFIVSRKAAAGNYDFLNALNQQQISPQDLSQLSVAKKGGVIRKYAEGGVVGAEMSQFNIGSPGALATPLGAEGLSDSLIQLVDIVQGIKDTVDQETGDKAREKALGKDAGETRDTAGGDVNQEITNNVSVTVNIAKDGSASSETDTSTEGEEEGDKKAEDDERNEQFAELMQGVVLQTIVEEQRPGGLLWKK